jgi:hypothetical protein
VTLILGAVSRDVAVQVGDRLLTARGKEWDPLANKSVVVLGYDGFVCVSYSGLAHILNVPTDQWLAEILADRQVAYPPARADRGAPAHIDSSFRPSVGLGLRRLKTAMAERFRKETHAREHAHGLYVLVTGFLGKPTPWGRRVRPVIMRYVYRDGAPASVREETSPRHWPESTPTYNAGIGGGDPATLSDAASRIGKPGYSTSPEVRDLLRDSIVKTSAKMPSVGSNCLSVTLSRWGHVEVAFMPAPANRTPEAYTPWILGPGGVFPPQISVGAPPVLHFGGFSVVIDKNAVDSSARPSSLTSQKRKKYTASLPPS